MKLTGVEIPFRAPFILEPNTVFAVISDQDGVIRMVKIDKESIPDDAVFLRAEANNDTAVNSLEQQFSFSGEKPKVSAAKRRGCFVRLGDMVIWTDPCEKPD